MDATERATETGTGTGRLIRGAVGGIVAGAAFMAVNMWFVSTMGEPATKPFRLISTLALGKGALQAGTTSVSTGVAVHLVISILFGVVFALVAPWLKTNGTVALAGLVFGALVYVLDFLVLASTVLPQFQGPNDPLEFSAHLLFGAILALFFYSTGVRAGERFVDVT